MPSAAKTSMPIIGVVFLILGLLKFMNGGNWVVWVILGFLFGGFGIFGASRSGAGGDA